MEQPVAGEIESVDLDLGGLSNVNEADVAVRDHRLDLKMTVVGTRAREPLGGGYDPAHSMDGELLNDAIDGRRQELQPCPLLGLDEILGEAGAFRSTSASSP